MSQVFNQEVLHNRSEIQVWLPLADPGVEERGFVARVGSYEQQQVALLYAGDAGVQQVVGAQVSAVWSKNKEASYIITEYPVPQKTEQATRK